MRSFTLLVAVILAVPLLGPWSAQAADPVISGVAVDARATAAVVTWTTSEAVPTKIVYSNGATTLTVENATLATSHTALLTLLSPGTTVPFTIHAGPTTQAGAFTTTTALEYFLHVRGGTSLSTATKTIDEFDAAGDVDGRGYNLLAGAFSTFDDATGMDFLATSDAFRAQNGALALAPGTAVATLFLRVNTGVGGAPAPGTVTFRASLVSGGVVLATGTSDVLVSDASSAYRKVEIAMPTTTGVAPQGTLDLVVGADRGTLGWQFGVEGDHASRVSVPVLAGLPPPPPEVVRKTDFTQGARVVVAVVDTGINPYHETYRRAGAVMPLASFLNNGATVARTIDLSDSGTYAERVAADAALWDSIQPNELVWFKDTNVLAISKGFSSSPTTDLVRDTNGHGTWTTSTVLANFPDAIIVQVQNSDGGLEAAIGWAASQPWIDVISTSYGAQGNLPAGILGRTHVETKRAFDAGKVVVNSAGNDPSPLPTDYLDGPTWVIAATGSQADGRAKEVLSANIYPDYVAAYTVEGATFDAVTGTTRVGGTSFSCPTVAGTAAGIIYGVREAKGHTGGITAKALAPGFTNKDLRHALNKTAVIPARDGYVLGLNYNGDHAHPPFAEFVTAQWGEVSGDIIDEAVAAALANDYSIPPEKAQVAQWKALTYTYRSLYWRLYGG